MSMTIAQLKNELTSHGVPLPEANSRKDVYEKLYREHVMKASSKQKKPNGAETFSSDEELPETNGNGHAENQDHGGEVLPPEVVAEVEKLSNEEIYTALTGDHGQQIGPVVASTRQMYKKRLARLSVGRDTSMSADGQTPFASPGGNGHINAQNDSSNNFESPAHFSTDEESDPYPEITYTDSDNEKAPVPKEQHGSIKLSADEKERLERMLSSSYYSSPAAAGPSPSTSRRAGSVQKAVTAKKTMPSESTPGFSANFYWVVAILVILFGYLAYEIIEEKLSNSESGITKPEEINQ